MKPFRRVFLESPLAGDVARNQRFLKACLLDCLQRDESPYASHGLLPLCLNDSLPHERKLGLDAGRAWRASADATVAYCDLGISPGMESGIREARAMGQAVELRTLGVGWDKERIGSEDVP